MSSGGLLLLILDVADVEHEPYQSAFGTDAQRPALQAIPQRQRLIAGLQAYAQFQRGAVILQGLQMAAQLIAVGGMHVAEPVLDRDALGLQAEVLSQCRRQLHFGAGAADFPPTGAEQCLEEFQSFQLLMMTVLAQSLQQRRGDGGSQQQPVVIVQVGRLLRRVIVRAQQPCRHALSVAVGHGKTFVRAEQRTQSRLLARQQTLRQGAVQAVEGGAQALLITPHLRCIRRRVVLMNLPALTLLVEQGHRHTGNAQMLTQALQLFAQHLRKAGEAAQTQLIANLCGQPLALLTAARLPPFAEQVTDVQQLQKPAVTLRLHPAAQMQWQTSQAEKIQVEQLALPVDRSTFQRKAAVRQ